MIESCPNDTVAFADSLGIHKCRLRRIVEGTRALLICIDIHGKLAHISRSVRTTLGYERGDLIGKSYLRVVHPEDKDSVRGAYPRRPDNWTQMRFRELRVIARSGEIKWIDFEVGPLKDNGEVVGLSGVGLDITDRKKAEGAFFWQSKASTALSGLASVLIGNQQWIEHVASLVLDAAKTLTGSRDGYVSAVDPDTGGIVNQTANRGTGNCDVAEGERKIDFHRGANGLYDELLAYGLDTGEAFYTNSPQTHRSYVGTSEDPNVLQSFLSAPVMVDGKLFGQIALCNSRSGYADWDLDAVKRIAALCAPSPQRHGVHEELLKHQHELEMLVEEGSATLLRREEQYKRLVEGSPGILYSHSIKQGGMYYSPYAESVLGCGVSELRENPFLWRDSIHQDDREKVAKAIQEFDAGKKFDLEYRIKDASGGWHWIRDRSIGRHEDDDDVIIEGLAIDITEQKKAIQEREQMELKLRQSQKMEAMGTLAGGIAHDFNNILGIISGYTEIALFNLPNVEEVERRMTQVLKASERAASLVEQILTFSRQKEQELIAVHIGGIIKEVIKLIRSSLPATIEIRTSIETKEDTVLADPTQIHQVLMNLASNAGHAMREKGGVLDLVLTDAGDDIEEVAALLNLPPGSYLELTVSDTGIGMPSSVAEMAFDPYFTTKIKGEGTGLGLSVVHGIMKKIGGAITVRSTPGRGTSFRMFLPKVMDRATENAELSQEIITGRENILLVDDEAELAKMTREMLEDIGYTVTVRTSGLEALEVFRRDADLFDLVITDQTMPQITGIELANALLRIRPDVRIILCSGYRDQRLEEQIEDSGISEFLMKPITLSGISKKIRNVADGL